MRRTAIAIGIALIVAACTRAGGEPSGAPATFVSPRSSSSQETATPPKAPEPLPSDPELRHAVEFRRSLSLRADLAYVEAVAGDPRATTVLVAIPLLPEEEAEVITRSEDADAVAAVANEYAASHADAFGGLYIDNESGAGVVTLWTGHLTDHEAAIRERLPAGSRIAFREVQFSERHLKNLQAVVAADVEWMAAIPAQWRGVGVDVIDNTVLLTLSSRNPEAVLLIEAHFDLGEALEVESDDTGVALIPWGEVAGRVRTAAGDVPPPAGYYLRWRGTDTRECGGGDVGYGLAEDGTFNLPCQAGTWTIEVTVPSGDGWRPIGEGTVEVPATGTVSLDIVLTEVP